MTKTFIKKVNHILTTHIFIQLHKEFYTKTHHFSIEN